MMPWAVWSPQERAVAAFTAAYWTGLALWGFASGAEHRWVYVPLMVLLVGVVVLVHDRWRLSPPVLWGLALWGLAHMAGGLVTVSGSPDGGILYTWWLWDGVVRYDHVLHGGGLFVATIAFSQITAGRAGALLTALMLGQVLGVVNEIVERIGSWTLPTANVGGAVDTMWDLAWNAAGGIAAALWLRHRSRARGRVAASGRLL